MPSEHLAGQSLGPIACHRRTKFSCRRHANPGASTRRRGHEQRHELAVPPLARLVDVLELRSLQETTRARQMFARAASAAGRPASSHRRDQRSSATVRRFRPWARRRFRTMRPFFVAILTRKPCAFARRRLLGWYVRLPFMSATVRPYQPLNWVPLFNGIVIRLSHRDERHRDGLISVARANPDGSLHRWRRQSLCLVLQSPIPEDRWQKDTCLTRHLGFPPKISTNCGKGCGNRARDPCSSIGSASEDSLFH